MTVAILGAGPAGLMSAWACHLMEVPFTIYSHARKSPLFGAQYLHAPIPGITNRDERIDIDYHLRGSVDDYRRKVYGQLWDGTVSPEDLEESHSGWNLRATYDQLWEFMFEFIEDNTVDARGIRMLSEAGYTIINTIPLSMLCHQGHTFRATEIWAAGDAPDLGIDVGRLYRTPPNTVLLNGEDNPAWYRISNIFGHTTVEWPSEVKPPVTTASLVRKPLSHNCDCWPDMLKVGRFGSWEKGVLSHTAFIKVQEAIRDGKAA